MRAAVLFRVDADDWLPSFFEKLTLLVPLDPCRAYYRGVAVGILDHGS